MGGFLALISWNPDWEIELIFAPTPSKISLEELKKMIFKSFRKELDMWEENTDFEEFRDKLSAVTSTEQIFAIFGEVYRKSHHE
jgi:hypothetical protein